MSQPINITETIDNSQVRSFQIGVFVLCGLCLIMDGFDGQSWGYVAPSLFSEWHMTSAAGRVASFTLTGSLNLFAVPASQGYATYGNTGDNYFESVDRFDRAPYNGGKGNDVYVTRTNADDVSFRDSNAAGASRTCLAPDPRPGSYSDRYQSKRNRYCSGRSARSSARAR